MPDLTISLPEPTRRWVESAVRDGGFADAGDYLRALIARDRDERTLTRDELEALLIEAEASGVSERTIDEIASAAKAKAVRG